MTRKLGEDRELTPLDFLLFGPSVTFLSARTSDGFAPVARALVPAFFVLFHLVIGFRIEQARHDARRRGRSRVSNVAAYGCAFQPGFPFGRPGTDRVADPRLRCNGFALLPRSVPLPVYAGPAGKFARSPRSATRLATEEFLATAPGQLIWSILTPRHSLIVLIAVPRRITDTPSP